jgi:hypothetical protein
MPSDVRKGYALPSSLPGLWAAPINGRSPGKVWAVATVGHSHHLTSNGTAETQPLRFLGCRRFLNCRSVASNPFCFRCHFIDSGRSISSPWCRSRTRRALAAWCASLSAGRGHHVKVPKFFRFDYQRRGDWRRRPGTVATTFDNHGHC